ncbi:MAG TPA: hypothetical protein VNW29_01905 [Candidatus Sulfotelmatobacter sp.]|jgi:hypothetical protein|nr:hypothetical protein [Candidatus Sulfotelmatobacter sp.]
MKKRTYGYVLPSKELRQPLLGKWKIYRQRGKRILSPSGQLKLEWIIFYHTIGNKNASFTAHQFGIARKTLHNG